MNYSHKWALLRAIWSERYKHPLPAFITLDATPHCNLTCIGCKFHSPLLKHHYAGQPADTAVSLELIQRLIRDIQPHKMHLFIEGSGEPFVHPHIVDILSLLKKADFTLTVFTNGTLIDKEIAQKLIELQVDTVRFSLFAASETSFGQNYAGTDINNFSRILKNIKQLKSMRREKGVAKPRVQLFFVVNRNNRHELKDAIELAGSTGCDGITFGRFVELGAEVSELTLDKLERAQLCEQLGDMPKELRKRSLTGTLARDRVMQIAGPETWLQAPCLIGWFHARIRGNGDVVPCCRCSYLLGNLNEASFSEIWHGERMHEFRRRTAAADGMHWLAEQGAQCHDCPHIPEMIQLYRVQRTVQRLQKFLHIFPRRNTD